MPTFTTTSNIRTGMDNGEKHAGDGRTAATGTILVLPPQPAGRP